MVVCFLEAIMAGVVVVTGASRGIGAATARLCAEAGYAVCVNYLQQKEQADEVVRSIKRSGGQALAVQGDVADEGEVSRMFSVVDQKLGQLTGLVNNAGIGIGFGRVEDAGPNGLRRMLHVNVLGAFLCSAAAVRRMARKSGGNGGAIVNVSSAAARLGGANAFVDYAATKGAQDVYDHRARA